MTVPESALENALACLERFSNHPDTAAIHDPIYALLRDGGIQEERAVARALLAHPSHPASVELRSVLEGHLELGSPSLGSVLEGHGPLMDSTDLVAEVDRRLHAHKKVQRLLRLEIDHVESKLARSERASNAVAALGAFALMFALFGWVIALGWVEIQWMDSPTPTSSDAAMNGSGSPSQGEVGRKP